MDPLISVIIPTYNRAAIVSRAVACVLHQTHKNLELIVVDDGSTDQTANTLKQFTDPRLKVIRHTQNRGLPSTRNTGVAHASGSWLAFLDDDDTWPSTKLATQLSFMQDSKRSSGTASVTDYLETHPNGNVSYHHNSDLPDINRAIIAGLGPAMGSSLMVKRDVFHDVGNFHEVRGAEDRDWLLRFLKKGYRLDVVPEFLMLYAGSHTPNTQAEIQALKDIRTLHQQTFQGQNPDYHKAFNAGAAWRLARVQFKYGYGFAPIARELLRAAIHSPSDTAAWTANVLQRRISRRLGRTAHLPSRPNNLQRADSAMLHQ